MRNVEYRSGMEIVLELGSGQGWGHGQGLDWGQGQDFILQQYCTISRNFMHCADAEWVWR